MIKYCRCGEPIVMQSAWNGLNWVTVFYPLMKKVVDRGKVLHDNTGTAADYRITHCPGCGEFLSRGQDLLDEPPDTVSRPTIQSIARDVLTLARERQDQASDLVASIHAVWQEVGLALAREMHRIREEERNRRNS